MPGHRRALPARLVAAMRTATAQTDFSGEVTVAWRNVDGHLEHSTVDVRAADGVVEVTADGQVVLDEGGHTFLKDDLGWTSPVSEPTPGRRPSPDTRWTLAVRHGTSHDRDVSTVVATRARRQRGRAAGDRRRHPPPARSPGARRSRPRAALVRVRVARPRGRRRRTARGGGPERHVAHGDGDRSRAVGLPRTRDRRRGLRAR